MAKLLIHIHTGPKNPTKATLSCLVGLTGRRERQGTGKLADHLAGFPEAGVPYFLSGMSAKARGCDESLLDGFDAQSAMPDKLVALATQSDTVLCH